MNNVFKRALAITLSLVTVFSTGMVANAAELPTVEVIENENGEKQVQQVESSGAPLDKFLPDIENEEIKVVGNASEIKVATTKTVDTDSAFASCRLIITSAEEIEFKEESHFVDTIKSVQHFEDKYVVEYASVEDTENAYNYYKGAGYEIEVDVVSNTPELENKDSEGQDVDKTEIAGANIENENTYIRENDILVAVLDSGINSDEEIFKDRLIDGYDFAGAKDNDKSKYPKDIAGHGTTMSRIIIETARSDKLKIMPIKVLDDEGKGTTLTAYQGIKYVIDYNKTHENKVKS